MTIVAISIIALDTANIIIKEQAIKKTSILNLTVDIMSYIHHTKYCQYHYDDTRNQYAVNSQRHVRSHVSVFIRSKLPARVKNRPCQHHRQPCNRTCQIGILLSQLQRYGLSPFAVITLLNPVLS